MQSYKYNHIHCGVALLRMLCAVAFVFHKAAQLKIWIRNWLAEKMEFTKIKFGGKTYIFQYIRDKSIYSSSSELLVRRLRGGYASRRADRRAGVYKSSKNGVFIKLIFEVLIFYKDAKLSFKKKGVFYKKCTFSWKFIIFFEGKRPLVDIDLLQNLSHLNFL